MNKSSWAAFQIRYTLGELVVSVKTGLFPEILVCSTMFWCAHEDLSGKYLAHWTVKMMRAIRAGLQKFSHLPWRMPEQGV